MGLLEGKRALIFGVANERSIAYGIAKCLKSQGADIALSFANDALKKRVIPLAKELGASFTFEMDVTNDDHYKELANTIKENWESFDILIHSIAFADRKELKDDFVKTTRSGFKEALDISTFSLVGLTHELLPLLNPHASIIAMSYYGAQKVVKNYNVMGVAKAALESTVRYLAYDLGDKGIRVNAISAGAIKTLAASGIAGFRDMLAQSKEISPLKRNITLEDVGKTALYLGSSLSESVTGQVIYVDAGISILGGVS